MIPNKNPKPQQKPSSKSSHILQHQSRSIDTKKSQHSESVKSKSNLSKRDPKVLPNNASKKKDEIDKKPKAETSKQQKKQESKNSKKPPQKSQQTTHVLHQKTQVQKSKTLKPQLQKNFKPENQKTNKQKDKDSSLGSDVSRTLSNDKISINLPNKSSKTSNTNGLATNQQNKLMPQKNKSDLTSKNKPINTPQDYSKQDHSKSSVQKVESLSKKENYSKSKSADKTDNEFIRIPSYSEEELRKIDLKINQVNDYQQNEIIQAIVRLMCWIWQANTPHKSSNKIDSPKCFRRLLKLYANEHAQNLFWKKISLNKIRFQHEILFQVDNHSHSQRPESQQQSLCHKPVIEKRFFIYGLINEIKIGKCRQVPVPLIYLLLEIIVFNYDDVSNLDEEIPSAIIRVIKNSHVKSKEYKTFPQTAQQIIKELIIFAFSQLHYLRNNIDRSSLFMRKKKLEGILWKFFMDFIKIFHHQIKAKEFVNFRICEALTLDTSFRFVTEFTHYARRFPLKNLDHFINIIEFQAFAETFVQRVIEFHVYVLQLKDRQKNSTDIEIDGPNQLFKFSFDLPIYDWAILAIVNDERKTFDNLVKYCKKVFLKNLQKKSTSKYETFINKPYVNDRYARFTIQELPDEQKSFYENSQHQQRRQIQEENSGYKLSYQKLKGFVSIPHMNFLVFKELVPLSVKRLASESKLKNSVEKLEPHLLFLLILSNSSYLLQLVKEVEYSCIEMLSPEIGKGLILLCNHCHEFKSVVIAEKCLKKLKLNSLHKEMTQKVFEKDTDYQRRLSTSIITKNSTTRINERTEESKENVELQKIEPPEIFQIRVKSCETMYFEMIFEIEKVMPFIKLDHYLNELLKKPTIFCPERFYVKLLQTQNPSSARIYFQELITHYVDEKLRVVELITYFEIFSDFCLKKDIFDEMNTLVQSLSIEKLFKFHSLLFSETFFDQTSYRILIPDGISKEERFNILTSAGYEEKTKFIDQQCPSISEVILWRKYLKPILPFEKVDKYICIKCFFIIVHQVFSDPNNSSKNHGFLDFIVKKLKDWIQKDKVDQVASAFHFLSLAFFPHQQSKINSNLSKNIMKDRRSFFGSKIVQNESGIEQKMILQILYIIKDHSVKLIQMFKTNESLTLRCLGEVTRNRVNGDDKDDQLDEMKRRQVMKMLNKMRNTHDYMIRCIVRFVENLNYTHGLLRNFHKPEEYLETIKKICRCEHMEKDQKRNQGHDEYLTPKLSYKLSSVSSNHLFQSSLQNYLKRYKQNPKYFHERYHFLAMIRCIAQMWIEEKLPSSKNTGNSQNETKNKSQLVERKKQSKTKDKDGHNWLSGMISPDKIFEICIECLNIPISVQNGIRECEMLKQKLVAFETLAMLFSSFTQKYDILKFMAPSIAKIYKEKYHSQVCQIILELLMKNPTLIGKEQREKDLMSAIRLKALSLVIQNFKGNDKYDTQEWKILQTCQHFWFLINTLVFDKNVQIRLFIIKSLYSRNKKFLAFRESFAQKLVVSVLIASQQNVKTYEKFAKKSLTNALQKFFVINHTNAINVFNLTAMQYFLYLVNFNTVHFLQKGELKLDYKEFFEVWIDLIFDKKQAETYLYAILDYFNEIVDSRGSIEISQMFLQLKWPFDINIDFYMMTRPSRGRMALEINSGRPSNDKLYKELLEDIKGEIEKDSKNSKKPSSAIEAQKIYDRKYSNSNQIFKSNIIEALTIMKEIFYERAAKSNKKQLKTKKPQSVLRNFGGVFNPNLKNKKEEFKNLKSKNEEKKPTNEYEIEI